MTVVENIARVIGSIDAAKIPASAQELLALHIADTMGASLTGAATPDGQAMIESVGKAIGGNGVAALTNAPLDQLALATAVTRLSEVDDIHLPSGTTPSSIIVPAALALSAQCGVTDAPKFASAVLAGLEMMTRIGTAIGGHSTGYRSLWATYFSAPVAVAAVTARLLDLDEAKTAHAIAIAFTLITGRIGKPGANRTARWLSIGQAARAGGYAALTAAQDFVGDLTLLDGDWLSKAHDLDADTELLSAPIEGGGVIPHISFKPYCSAKQMIAAICGFEEILGRGVTPDEITHVKVFVPKNYAAMIDHGVIPGVRLSSLTSAPYQLSMAAYHKDSLFDVARSEYVLTEKVTGFMNKVSIEIDPDLSSHFPTNWPARLEVKTSSGSEEVTVIDAPGDPGNAMSPAELEQKFHNFTDGLIGQEGATNWYKSAIMAAKDDTALVDLQDKFMALIN